MTQSVARFISSASGDAIVTTAPCRADLAGGTLDIGPCTCFIPAR